MIRARSWMLLLFLLAICPTTWADYLSIQRPVTLKSKPDKDGAVIAKLEAGTYLVLTQDQQRGGYYRAEDPSTSRSGWVYRTFVRRHAGQLPPAFSPSRNGTPEDDDPGVDADAGIDGTVRSNATDEAFEDYQPYSASGRYYLYAGLPDANSYSFPVSTLRNSGFVVGYCETRKSPAWSAYRVFAHSGPSIPRPSRFMIDHRTLAKIKHDDYTDSGFDRGHMTPNHAIATRYGRHAQLETFLMSNICPQTPAMNRGISAALEQVIADQWAVEHEEVWVLVGPIFGAAPSTIGPGVQVPEAFFMIVVDEQGGQPRLLAFVIAQQVRGDEPLEQFLASVDEIERLTRLDFLKELEDSLEESLESKRSPIMWPYNPPKRLFSPNAPVNN